MTRDKYETLGGEESREYEWKELEEGYLKCLMTGIPATRPPREAQVSQVGPVWSQTS